MTDKQVTGAIFDGNTVEVFTRDKPSGLDVALQAIDQAGIDRERVSQITLSLLEPPSVSVRYEAFLEAFRGREAETRLRDEWEHLELVFNSVKFGTCHQVAMIPLPKETKVLT